MKHNKTSGRVCECHKFKSCLMATPYQNAQYYLHICLLVVTAVVYVIYIILNFSSFIYTTNVLVERNLFPSSGIQNHIFCVSPARLMLLLLLLILAAVRSIFIHEKSRACQRKKNGKAKKNSYWRIEESRFFPKLSTSAKLAFQAKTRHNENCWNFNLNVIKCTFIGPWLEGEKKNGKVAK